MKRKTLAIICLVMIVVFMVGCGSEAKKAMNETVDTATQCLEKGEKPFDSATKTALEKAIEASNEASDDQAYVKATKDIKAALGDYKDSIKQLKQVTNPSEEFLLERAQKVPTIEKVEAATEKTDGNKLMNKKGGYIAYIAMQSSMVEAPFYKEQSPVESGCDGGAAFESFKNVKEAKARDKYLSSFDGNGFLAPGSHKVVGTLLIRTSDELTASQQEKLEKSIIESLIKLDK